MDHTQKAASALISITTDVARTVDHRDDARKIVRKLLIDSPLYATVEADEDTIERIDNILDSSLPLEFDLYCVTCGQTTPWTIRQFQHSRTGGGSSMRYTSQDPVPTIRVVNAVCLRKQHFYTYILYRKNLLIQKIGQKPSMADIAHGELKVIPGINSDDRQELGRALGLFAHDTPLGAFVYLRRVFERMINRSHENFKEANGRSVENWNKLRMGERVRALGDALPGDVASSSGVFGLLSKSLHELSDQDAETLFPLVKAVIFQMLGDEERHRQTAKARQETARALQIAIAQFNPPTHSQSVDPD
jgi:hypothetical protein